MNNDGVTTAFELIIEEIGSVINELNKEALGQIQAGKYSAVKKQMDIGEKLQVFQDTIYDLNQKWHDSFDNETRNKTIFESRDEFISLVNGSVEIEMKYGGSHANGVYTNGRIKILAKSTIRKANFKSMGRSLKSQKTKLLKSNELIPHDEGLLYMVNSVSFSSPSSSAKFVAGCSVNGRKEWVVKDTSNTLGEWIKEHSKN